MTNHRPNYTIIRHGIQNPIVSNATFYCYNDSDAAPVYNDLSCFPFLIFIQLIIKLSYIMIGFIVFWSFFDLEMDPVDIIYAGRDLRT